MRRWIAAQTVSTQIVTIIGGTPLALAMLDRNSIKLLHNYTIIDGGAFDSGDDGSQLNKVSAHLF